MVQAILQDRKTQTRRILAEKSMLDKEWGLDREPYCKGGKWYYEKQTKVDESKCYELNPYCQPGSILWVRETWCKRLGDISSGQFIYRAHAGKLDEIQQYALDQNKWRPSIHMPREAARIFLKVEDVRIERLQSITPLGISMEGLSVPRYTGKSYIDIAIDKKVFQSFKALWDSLYEKKGFGWDANPWVWVYEFKRIGIEEVRGE